MLKIYPLLLSSIFFANISAQTDPYFIKDLKKADEVNCVCYSPDGKKILAGYFDGSARIIDIESEKVEVTVKDHWKGVNAVEMDPNGKYFMTAGDNTIKIWSPDGNPIYTLKNHTTSIFSADLDPTGKFIVSGAINKVFKEWDALQGELKRNITGHDDVAMAVCYSRDGRRMASGSGDHTLKIWDAESANLLFTLSGHPEDVYGVDFSPNGKLLASCSKDKTIRIYDLETQSLLRTLKGHKNFVMDVEFSPDGLHLLSCSFDTEIKIWEVATGRCLYTFIDHDAPVTDICFAPDGKTFASASHDKKIKLWNFSKEIFVDYYYSPEIIEKMNAMEIFQPREKKESREMYQEREQKANQLRKGIYEEYYKKYLIDLEKGTLPGL